MADVTVIGSQFSGPGTDGDFSWMIEQPQYRDAFFIFNDNEDEFEAHQKNPDASGGPGCQSGGGNAAIRPYQCRKPPRAGGIPTGNFGLQGGPGYPTLTPEVRAIIDRAVVAIRTAVEENGYRRVIYSSDGRGGLGHGIFDPAGEVKRYIVEQIESLGS